MDPQVLGMRTTKCSGRLIIGRPTSRVRSFDDLAALQLCLFARFVVMQRGRVEALLARQLQRFPAYYCMHAG